MNLTEKISLIGNTNGAVPVDRLGVAALPWGEALHGVVTHCHTINANQTVCPTSFPHALALAASFNRTLWRSVGNAISTEARALNNLAVADDIGTGPYAPLMLWAPNLNPYRDPRWGRGHETPGECPYLTGEYGVQFISGLQNGRTNDAGYLKAAAVVKHWFDYDLEGNHGTDRTAFNANVSSQDQTDYFWPPFKAVVMRANASGLMCSYNAVNGVPSCMNAEANNDLVRQHWGLADGIIVSDCGAIGDTASTAYILDNFGGNTSQQVAQGLKAGCDFNCGKFYQAHLASALQDGSITSGLVDTSIGRLLKKAFQLGLFDRVEDVPYAQYGQEHVADQESNELALQGATQSIVLLKNDPQDDPVLPLKPGTKLALIGPQFNATTDMLSNYRGDNNVAEHHSPLQALSRRGDVVGAAVGSALWGTNESGFTEAVAVASKAEVALVFLGLHPQWFDSPSDGDAQEGEDHDRLNISLPAIQLKLLQAIQATGVSTVLVLINGGQVAVPWAKQHVPAIVEAFYPGQFGGDALASVLYGDTPPSGRLPYTIYDDDFTTRRPDIGDMSLSANGGITYQYYQGTPLWPFGWGLSFTTFALNFRSVGNYARGQAAPLYVVDVTNTGSKTSDVTILGFLSAGAKLHLSLTQPIRELFGFCRLRAVAPQQTVQCELAVDMNVLAHNGVVYAAEYSISVELGDGSHVTTRLSVG
eukprot:TRINITY_DN18976_c0_g1_i1.p1 TRINITY_DN18976_c0_g1~~TRINITY_DN18976_c0_g1_i1.p1  ORF type:complete len:703 (+),score=112.32 TRINITY_DN18976_c0_g1_i1:153-2261(+)